MISKIFSVYDDKAEAYLPPFYMSSKGQAIRSFSDAVNDPKHQFHAHAADYTLFELGSFDDEHASFHMLPAPQSLGNAVEFLVKS